MILCDSGPLFAAADRKDADHHTCVELFTGLRLANRRLLVPQTVVAEVGYLLQTKVGTFAEAAFLQALSDGDLELVDLKPEDMSRMAALVAQYDDLQHQVPVAPATAAQSRPQHPESDPDAALASRSVLGFSA